MSADVLPFVLDLVSLHNVAAFLIQTLQRHLLVH